jgi:hypothetical protein
MARIRDIGRGLPSREFNTQECLDRLKSSAEYSKHNPRFTADGWLVHDRCQVMRCEFSGKEYVEGSLELVLYHRPGERRTAIAYYGLRPGAACNLRALQVHRHSLDELISCGIVHRFDFIHLNTGTPQTGYAFVRTSQTHDGLRPGSCTLIPHDCLGETQECPEGLMRAVSSMYYSSQTNCYYYNYNDVPAPPVPVIRNYHDHRNERAWQDLSDIDHATWVHMRDRKARHKRMFGVELEIKSDTSTDRDSICEHAMKLGLLAEQDGSLDAMRGVEIVGPPLEYHEYPKADGIWMQFLDFARQHAVGWGAGEGYGMHVSLNRAAMTTAVGAKVFAAFNAMQSLCVNIAGRHHGTWAPFVLEKRVNPNYAKELIRWSGLPSRVRQNTPPPQQYLSETSTVATVAYGYRGYRCAKMRAASIRNQSRIEVRIFRSCLNADRFLRNIQFCDAIWSWCEVCSIQDIGRTEAFLMWLGANQYHYPDLAAYLAQMKPQPYKVTSGKVKKCLAVPETLV